MVEDDRDVAELHGRDALARQLSAQLVGVEPQLTGGALDRRRDGERFDQLGNVVHRGTRRRTAGSMRIRDQPPGRAASQLDQVLAMAWSCVSCSAVIVFLFQSCIAAISSALFACC